jgi:two-component system, LytTR family, response regulator
MTLSCLIVDDEPLARNLLTEYVRKIPWLRLEKACSNPLEAMEILRSAPPDLLFLDVQMPEITGIGLLKAVAKKPYVILTTAYSEYALEGYELDVMDYLLKPITFERFLKSVEKAAQRIEARSETETTVQTEKIPKEDTGPAEPLPDFIFIKDGTKLVKVRLADVMYVEGLKDYASIYTPQQKIVTLQRLKNLEAQLPADRFIRIHNSYIVALDWIDTVHKERVQIGKTLLPVSDTYQKAFRAFVSKYIKNDLK